MNQDNISFDLPKNRSNVIKVIGVAGGGSNAVNYMYKQGFKGVDFVVCNTDAQALHSSPVPNKVQLGVNLTEGLGAGARPEIGGEAAIESISDLETMLMSNTKMLFLTAGMGGGTGTGAAPVIAKLASKLGILTVGIVTMPFKFEGAIRMKQAQAGMEALSEHVDSMIVINNNKLRDVYGNLGLKSGFAKADEVLATAAKGISEVITKEYGMNIDLHDVKTVLEKSGTAIMGAAMASGENRAINAIAKALDSPLLNDNSIKGAKNVLLLVVSGETEITLDEIGEINEYIQEQAGGYANIILGAGDEEEGIGDNIKITIIATGFSKNIQDTILEKEPEKKIYVLGSNDSDGVVASRTKEIEEVKTVVKEVEIVEEPIQSAPRIVHTLEEDYEVDLQVSESKVDFIDNTVESTKEVEIDDTVKEDVIKPINLTEPVTNEIVDKVREFRVVEENDIMNVSDNDIVIQDIDDPQTSIEFDFGSINNANFKKEEQVIEKVPEKKFFDLGSDLDEIEDVIDDEVKNEITVNTSIPTSKIEAVAIEKETNVFVDGSKRYNLEDFEELESKIESATPAKEVEEVEPEMQIHIIEKSESVADSIEQKKIIEEPLPVDNFIDSAEVPLSKIEEIGRERRERLKRFNHNFKTRSLNPSSVDDLERQPAYLRAGLDVTSSNKRTSASRYSIENNGDDEVVIRKNNSFLHDNVD